MRQIKDLQKLKYSLYGDPDNDAVDNWRPDKDWKLFARKGQIAERKEITDEIREEYCITEKMWETIYIFKNGEKWVLCQDDCSDWFEPIKRR